MAASFSPLSQQSPGAGAAVDPSNPFYATFWANQAALNFSTERILAQEQRATSEANASYAYGRGVNQRAEPLRLTANQNSANSQGLAESGVLAKNQTQTQVDYSQKNQRLQEARRSAVERAQEGERNAVTSYGLDTAKDVAAAQQEGLKEQLENPSSPEGSKPANPGGVRTVAGPPGPGGVVPYTETSRRGSVAVGSATRAAREQARKKAVGVG